jgi:flagellar hook-associated protein 3 FlgL
MITQTEQTLYRLSMLDAAQEKISYQMSTGKKLQNGSDDSELYARQLYVDDKIRMYEGLETQIQKTNAQNNVADSTIGEIKSILEFVKSEMIKANTSTTTDEGLKAIAVNVEGMKQNLLDLANTQIEGEYLFAGSDSSIRPFSEDSSGKVNYDGDNQLRKVAVEDGSYRQRGVNGYDVMYYPTSTAYKGEELTFTADSKIFDEQGMQWKLNGSNDTLEQYDFDGNLTGNQITGVVGDGNSPETFTAIAPVDDGTKLIAKTSIFDVIDTVVNSLNKVDSNGNPISEEDAKAGISKGVDDIGDAYDGVNVAHADLGGRNRVFEVSLERVSSKLTQFNVLSTEIGAADLSKVAIEAKALELTYTALYSTINRTSQLSLVNFIR